MPALLMQQSWTDRTRVASGRGCARGMGDAADGLGQGRRTNRRGGVRTNTCARIATLSAESSMILVLTVAEQISDLSCGDYALRCRAFNGYGEGPFSTVVRFTLGAAQRCCLPLNSSEQLSCEGSEQLPSTQGEELFLARIGPATILALWQTPALADSDIIALQVFFSFFRCCCYWLCYGYVCINFVRMRTGMHNRTSFTASLMRSSSVRMAMLSSECCCSAAAAARPRLIR